MKSKFRLTLVIMMILFGHYSYSTSFIINMPEAIENTHESMQIQAFYTAVYADLNIKPSYMVVPAKRAFKYLKNNTIQAEAFRTESIGRLNTLSTRLSPPITHVSVALFCIEPKLCDLKRPAVYAIPSGFENGKLICKRLGASCEFINEAPTLIKMLESKRVDAVLSPYPAYKKLLCLANKNSFYFNELSDDSFNIYHYINSRDEKLISKIEKSLKTHLKKGDLDLRLFTGPPDLKHCNKQLYSI